MKFEEIQPQQPEIKPIQVAETDSSIIPVIDLIDKKTGSNSTNMFSAPLLAMIVAIPIIFLLSK